MSTIIFISGLLIGSWQNKNVLNTTAKKMLRVLKLQNKPGFENVDYDSVLEDYVYKKKRTESNTNEQD